jgi:pimeloyl-ACP methyl ester carboxylesterase
MDLPEGFAAAGTPRPVTLREHAEAQASALSYDETIPGNPPSPYLKLVRTMRNDPRALAAALRGDSAEQVTSAALRGVQIPVLVLNGKEDAANQSVGGLLEALPNSRFAACDGDHHSTPWQPSFQGAVVEFLAGQWTPTSVPAQR